MGLLKFLVLLTESTWTPYPIDAWTDKCDFGFFFLQRVWVEMTKQNVVVSDTDSQIMNMAISVAVSNSSIFSAAAEKPPIAPGGYISISRKRLMNLKNLDIINGGERITSWVDSMKASSPTHIQSTTCLMKGQSSWMVSTRLVLSLLNWRIGYWQW